MNLKYFQSLISKVVWSLRHDRGCDGCQVQLCLLLLMTSSCRQLRAILRCIFGLDESICVGNTIQGICKHRLTVLPSWNSSSPSPSHLNMKRQAVTASPHEMQPHSRLLAEGQIRLALLKRVAHQSQHQHQSCWLFCRTIWHEASIDHCTYMKMFYALGSTMAEL